MKQNEKNCCKNEDIEALTFEWFSNAKAKTC